jgi:probable HAF family extracellular repeat protein
MSTVTPAARLALAGCLLLGFSRSADAQFGPYELVVLEPVGGSAFDASGFSDVNDVGLVVGRNSIQGNLVHLEWTRAGGFRTPTHLPPGLAERRLNNVGDSIGIGSTFLIRSDGTLVPILDPLGVPTTGASDLNDSARVVGHGIAVGTSSGLFTWTPQGGSVAIPIPSGSLHRRVNAHGIGVGYRLINGTNTRAFVVDTATLSWIDLHALLPGSGNSEAVDVNDHGAVVGFGPDGVSSSAFVWTQATGFVFLPGLLGGETMRVHPQAIDNQGRVVGRAMTGAGDFRAFLWDPALGMVDLNSLVNPGTYKLIDALDISETGVIIGRGFHGVWGPDRGFILYEPAAGVGYCDGVVNSTGQPGVLEAQRLDWGARTMELAASQLPANTNAFSLASLQSGFVAHPGGSSGNLCLGGAIGRRVGGGVLTTDAAGTLLEPVDLNSMPQPAGPVVVLSGETWHFQVWYRDSVLGQSTSNFTGGVQVVFP